MAAGLLAAVAATPPLAPPARLTRLAGLTMLGVLSMRGVLRVLTRLPVGTVWMMLRRLLHPVRLSIDLRRVACRLVPLNDGGFRRQRFALARVGPEDLFLAGRRGGRL